SPTEHGVESEPETVSDDDTLQREIPAPPLPPLQNVSAGHAEVEYYLIRDPETLANALTVLRQCTVVGIDTETTGLDPWIDRVRLLQLAAPGWPVFVIDLWQIPEEARDPLRQFLAAPTCIKLFHNAKFDLAFLRQAHLPVQGPLWDTMLASQLLDAGLHSRRH